MSTSKRLKIYKQSYLFIFIFICLNDHYDNSPIFQYLQNTFSKFIEHRCPMTKYRLRTTSKLLFTGIILCMHVACVITRKRIARRAKLMYLKLVKIRIPRNRKRFQVKPLEKSHLDNVFNLCDVYKATFLCKIKIFFDGF